MVEVLGETAGLPEWVGPKVAPDLRGQERQGVARARGYIAMAEGLWRDADPELRDPVEAAQARLREIVERRG